MPASPKAKSISIRVDLVPELTREWEKDLRQQPGTNKELGGYINDVLEDVIKKKRRFEQLYPHLSKEGYTGNTLFIFDATQHKRAEVYLYRNRIKCDLCDSFGCEHVYFALSLPEIARLNVRRSEG